MNFFPSIMPLPPPPPSPPQNVFTTTSGGVYSLSEAQISAIGDTSSSSSSSSSTSSIIIVSIVISSAILLSITIYALIRFISRRFPRSSHIDVPRNATTSEPPIPTSGDRNMVPTRSRLDSLPLFKFGSLTKNLTDGGDCAVCLSKFESNNQLRLLPLCCHAFHARCIDTWLSNNQTCPLCRSTVFPTEADVSNKITSISRGNENTGDSFRIEIGSVSQRRGLPDAAVEGIGERRRTYTLGSFDYIVDDGFEIPVDTTKEYVGGIVVEAPPGECLAAEVGGGSGRNWLKDYVDRLTSFSVSSQSTSFRSSGRFFSGSSRRNDVVPVDEDLEANHRVGEEISELFRWISGV